MTPRAHTHTPAPLERKSILACEIYRALNSYTSIGCGETETMSMTLRDAVLPVWCGSVSSRHVSTLV